MHIFSSHSVFVLQTMCIRIAWEIIDFRFMCLHPRMQFFGMNLGTYILNMHCRSCYGKWKFQDIGPEWWVRKLSRGELTQLWNYPKDPRLLSRGALSMSRISFCLRWLRARKLNKMTSHDSLWIYNAIKKIFSIIPLNSTCTRTKLWTCHFSDKNGLTGLLSFSAAFSSVT